MHNSSLYNIFVCFHVTLHLNYEIFDSFFFFFFVVVLNVLLIIMKCIFICSKCVCVGVYLNY